MGPLTAAVSVVKDGIAATTITGVNGFYLIA